MKTKLDNLNNEVLHLLNAARYRHDRLYIYKDALPGNQTELNYVTEVKEGLSLLEHAVAEIDEVDTAASRTAVRLANQEHTKVLTLLDAVVRSLDKHTCYDLGLETQEECDEKTPKHIKDALAGLGDALVRMEAMGEALDSALEELC